MEARYTRRKNELLQDCQVAPEIFDLVIPRLHHFLEPFVSSLSGHAPLQHARTYVSGLLSDVERKNIESIAYHFGQDRLGLQGFIGWDDWDDTPMRQELLHQVGQQLGHRDGVLVFDPSAFAKSGRESVGVARQWCGRLGKVDKCQVAIYLGYVSRKGHTLVDQRLFLPKDWTQDKARLEKAGVPKDRRGYRTRHQLALEMLAQDGPWLPHRWLGGDDEMGRPYWFRRRLRELNERYLLAVPSNISIRDLEGSEPEYSGKGRRPKRPWQSVSEWAEGLGDQRWKRLEVRDGSKGPLVVEAVKCRVVSRTHRRQQGDEELLVVIRYRDRDEQQVVKIDYSLSNAPVATGLQDLARVAKAAHRIEECLQRSKSEAGLADYEVRHWMGWQHHQTLSLLATWFLERETQRGKKMDSSHHITADSSGYCDDLARGVSAQHEIAYAGAMPEALTTQ